ncbi:hypothetical protein EV401DRAFT_1388225 [Pisolithus croceorrhizus]|nr:hypothetical protein EV401DRAFT_1388225 [Pisolithus croceorrhizus]
MKSCEISAMRCANSVIDGHGLICVVSTRLQVRLLINLVFLVGVVHPSQPRDLTHSLWVTRAWTLQELLAPKVIFFFDSEWKPYLGNSGTNHRESAEIVQELVDVIQIPRGNIVTFFPHGLNVHEK